LCFRLGMQCDLSRVIRFPFSFFLFVTMVKFAIIHSSRGNLWVSKSGHQFIKIDPERIAFSEDGENEILEPKSRGADVIHQFDGEAAVLIDDHLITGPEEWVKSIGAQIMAVPRGQGRVWTKKRARHACLSADEAMNMALE